MDDLKHRFPRYSKLIQLYPASYRQEYGEQILQTLADMLDAAKTRGEKRAVWTRAALDLPLSLTKQLIVYGGTMAHETPVYVKRNSIIGALLLLPFTLALSANALDKVIYNNTLYHSWLWSLPVLAIWVLWLPLAAALLATISMAIYVFDHKRQGPTSHKGIRAIVDVKHTWPLVIVGFGGLFVLAILFGHDSIHCVVGNPIHEAQHWQATLHCIRAG